MSLKLRSPVTHTSRHNTSDVQSSDRLASTRPGGTFQTEKVSFGDFWLAVLQPGTPKFIIVACVCSCGSSVPCMAVSLLRRACSWPPRSDALCTRVLRSAEMGCGSGNSWPVLCLADVAAVSDMWCFWGRCPASGSTRGCARACLQVVWVAKQYRGQCNASAWLQLTLVCVSQTLGNAQVYASAFDAEQHQSV